QKQSLKLTVHRLDAEVKTVNIEGKPRRAFRCGRPSGSDGICWAELSPSVADPKASDQALPVYVQGHALKNLDDRGPPYVRWVLRESLWRSLVEPEVAPMHRSPEKLLVAYRFAGDKMGYLVVSRHEEFLLIETFLTLTMDGTPEGTELWQELRLGRNDKE